MDFKSKPGKDPLTENGATENTPLLVPRIEEGQSGDEDRTKSNTAMFWEEMRILSKYTLPVFGSVTSLVLWPFIFKLIFMLKNAYPGIQFGYRICSLYRPSVYCRVSGGYFSIYDRQRLGFQYYSGIHKHPGHDASQRVDISPAPTCGLVVTANGSV